MLSRDANNCTNISRNNIHKSKIQGKTENSIPIIQTDMSSHSIWAHVLSWLSNVVSSVNFRLLDSLLCKERFWFYCFSPHTLPQLYISCLSMWFLKRYLGLRPYFKQHKFLPLIATLLLYAWFIQFNKHCVSTTCKALRKALKAKKKSKAWSLPSRIHILL